MCGTSSLPPAGASGGAVTVGYDTELARAHHEGFGQIAREAAATLLVGLADSGIVTGLVVDLGSGSGILARLVTDAGFEALGFDLSEAMVTLAAAHAPAARFVRAPVLDADLPACVAVTAIGEVFNYAFDPRTDLDHLGPLLRRIHQALEPGGLALFDVAGPGRCGPTGRRETVAESDGWKLRSVAEEDPDGSTLVRHISLVAADGTHHEETHVLRLYRPDDVAEAVAGAGFGDVRRLDRYRRFELPAGLHGFLARA